MTLTAKKKIISPSHPCYPLVEYFSDAVSKKSFNNKIDSSV